MPVGAVTQIRYMPQREKRGQQQEKKEHPFRMIFQAKLDQLPVEETSSFQVYC